MDKEIYDVPTLTAMGAFVEETGKNDPPNREEVILPWDTWF